MEKTLTRESASINQSTSPNPTDYRDGVWKFLEKEVVEILSEEIKKASQEILEEQINVIKQLTAEHKMVIEEILEKEKNAARAQTYEWRKQILTIVP
jgi:hypothetical protein